MGCCTSRSNMGDRADLTALADGLTEDIVTGLSRFSYLRVIARSSTSKHAHKATDVRAIGKELGARYVIEGNLRRVGSRLRIGSHLVDATSGAHLWAETYDRTFQPEEILTLQDDVVARIVSTVADTYGVLPRNMGELLLQPRRSGAHALRGSASQLCTLPAPFPRRARRGHRQLWNGRCTRRRDTRTDGPCSRCWPGKSIRMGLMCGPIRSDGRSRRHGGRWKSRHRITWRTMRWLQRNSFNERFQLFGIGGAGHCAESIGRISQPPIWVSCWPMPGSGSVAARWWHTRGSSIRIIRGGIGFPTSLRLTEKRITEARQTHC